MADSEIELMGALVDAISRKGVGPKGAVAFMENVQQIAGPIARLASEDPATGVERVERAVAYAADRARAMVANETPKTNDGTAEPVSDPDPKAKPEAKTPPAA